jgi:hypothetical protein
MLPDDRTERRAAFLRWANGNAAAADFLAQMAEIARLADDIIDEDDNRQRNMGWLLHRVLVVLPQNQFFIAHAAVLGPLMDVIIVQWQQSDDWRSSHNAMKRQFGFVFREAVGSLVTAVASITGGLAHAKAASDDYFELCHAASSETVAQWAMER